ncbi:MAG: MerR family transcriptional regulator, repressor of the yfmOP operon [Solirubrobacteraceae bacterium]|jgi:DNA-binding transcriptional MerR regulator|nr:MerR family transcriptional regulator, repressor of the yfmOP operon [Solirubrobacteraceae bacterium]
MSSTNTLLRIGDLAERCGTTTRTIRYYEEIGLLGSAESRAAGSHRAYTEADAERLELILRLKNLLGVSLDDLKTLIEAEDARAVLREEWLANEDPAKRRAILASSSELIDRQLELVRRRRAELDTLDKDLAARRRRNRELLAELS